MGGSDSGKTLFRMVREEKKVNTKPIRKDEFKTF